MEETNDFCKKLVSVNCGNPFPYIDPPEGWKPDFIVDALEYLEWFKNTYTYIVPDKGYLISFVQGSPGAGKTHFLRYLDYLFNVKGELSGLYSTYSAGQSKISSRDLWIDFFSKSDVANKIRDVISTDIVNSSSLDSRTKKNLNLYVQGLLEIENLGDDDSQSMAAGVNSILATKGVGICMIIDNVDEYFRYLTASHEIPPNTSEDETENLMRNDINLFFGTLRTTCRNMHHFFLLLACTDAIYTQLKRYNTLVDRTFSGRAEWQDRTLAQYTNEQAYELVYKYMNWWARNNGVEQPLVDRCTVRDAQGNHFSLYPFSIKAIDEIHEVTGKFARDIKTICTESISQMKIKKETWIVEGAKLYAAIENARKNRPHIIPAENFEKFKKRRVIWLEDIMNEKLKDAEKVAATRHPLLRLSESAVIDTIETFAKNIGIDSRAAPEIDNFFYVRRISTDQMRIWSFNNKNVLVYYLISNEVPMGNSYMRRIEWRDLSNTLSFLKENIATHVLFIKKWCGERSSECLQYNHLTSSFNPVMEELSLDEERDYGKHGNVHKFLRIVGAVEADEDDRKDLIEHVNSHFFRLTDTLSRLTARSRLGDRGEPSYTRPGPGSV